VPPLLNTREAGRFTFADPGADKPLLELGTVQCVHCGAHFPVVPGSGKVRGFCQNCNGPVCGPACAACVPTDLLLENIEKGRPEDFRPVIVPVSFTS